MKLTQIVKLLAVTGFCFTALAPATSQASFKEDARKVYTDNISSVVSIRGILKINITMKGNPAGSKEKNLISNGVVVSDGLVLVAYRTIKPSLEAKGQANIQLSSELSELKIVDASGEEYDAKLVLHDVDLGLAFVAINPKNEKSKSFKLKPVTFTKGAEVKILDDLLSLGRLPESLRSAGIANIGSITSIIKRPRTLYMVKSLSMSNPIFNQKGECIGFTVALKHSGNRPVVMPSKYILKLLDQAKAKQAELAK